MPVAHNFSKYLNMYLQNLVVWTGRDTQNNKIYPVCITRIYRDFTSDVIS